MQPSEAQRKALLLIHANNKPVKRLIAGYFAENHYIQPNTLQSLVRNGWLHKKIADQPLARKGNGYVISPEGQKVLASPTPPKRKAASIKASFKSCPDCKATKPIGVFVTIYGHSNPRAKYCRCCFDKHQQERAREILEGRDFCLYCGKAISKDRDYTATGRSAKTYVHCDHMDPLDLGGADEDSNTVYCCVSCNLAKSNQPFTVWLHSLKEPFKSLSREIYTAKHGYPPEHFKPEKQPKIYEYVLEIPNW